VTDCCEGTCPGWGGGGRVGELAPWKSSRFLEKRGQSPGGAGEKDGYPLLAEDGVSLLGGSLTVKDAGAVVCHAEDGDSGDAAGEKRRAQSVCAGIWHIWGSATGGGRRGSAGLKKGTLGREEALPVSWKRVRRGGKHPPGLQGTGCGRFPLRKKKGKASRKRGLGGGGGCIGLRGLALGEASGRGAYLAAKGKVGQAAGLEGDLVIMWRETVVFSCLREKKLPPKISSLKKKRKWVGSSCRKGKYTLRHEKQNGDFKRSTDSRKGP